jgi:hypothetical protein
MTEKYEPLRCPALRDIIEHGVEHGCRNEAAYRLSQYYAAPSEMLWEVDGELITVVVGLSYTEVRWLVESWNTRNRPPLVWRELLMCVRQGMKLPCSYGKFGQ